VPLVRFRAQAMQQAVPAGEGAMAAILGLDDAAIRAACEEAAQGQVVEAVNFNGPGQTVIAGHAAAVVRAADAAKAKGAKRAVMLPVSAPFHCSLMQPAAEALRGRLASVAVSAPRILVVNNVDALVRQARSPVRWVETIRAMAAQGVTHVFESGPGKVLAGLTKRIEGGLQGAALADAASLDQAVAEAT
jgi:[acyl-carrier-protein] S-malonyltransferase